MASWHTTDNRMPLAGVLLILGVLVWTVAIVAIVIWTLL